MNFVQPIRDPDVIEGIKHYYKLRSLRNYLLFCLGIYSGLRVSDLRVIRVWMVRGSHVNIQEIKNKNRKKFIIHPSIREDLDRYISGKSDHEFLFASRQIKTKSRLKNQPIDRSTVYKILNDAASQFGLQEIGTHTLRKTWGYHLYMQDPRNLALLMDMFGHSDPSVTLRYIGITQDMMDAAILRLK
ncbi:tyrosine-type recombinase/integrase [Virgibacillus salexigens]|uniref:Site-specific integrase n=1 Tax=Virgibacillus kapii TaxID=1638645 RepID=A0ABQ2DKS6_9BACI|nr:MULTISPECIES: tyrosine-type recombinase/integrase [Virgibacillus]GGJ61910.1 site-specific integrase [Virgibacillus kapii]